MKFLSVATAVALTSALANAAQTPTLPACASICFLRAVGKSNCSGLTDYYCQCTSGSKVIQESVMSCLCANEGTADGCSASELLQVQQVSNEICSSALAASSQTYTPVTAGLNACATGAAGTTGTGAASASASTTATSSDATGAATTASSAGAASTSSSGNGAPAATKMAMVGFEGAALGLAGMMMAAL